MSEEYIKIQKGTEKHISVSVLPSNATDKSIVWSSKDENIATIDNGKLYAVEEGTTEVVVASANGISKSITIEVFPITPSEIETSEENIILAIIDETMFTVKILPEDADNKAYSVTNEDSDIISIIQKSDTIYICPLSEGESTICIKTWNGVEKNIFVQVNSLPLEKITINNLQGEAFSKCIVDISEKKMELSCLLEPENCTYKDVEWSVSDDSIIKVC